MLLNKSFTFLTMLALAASTPAQQQFFNSNQFWESGAFKTPYNTNISENEKVAGLSRFWAEAKYN